MKKILKFSLIIFIIIFIIIFFSYQNGYYIDKNRQTMILTEEKIKEYENDLKNGVDVSNKDYLVIAENYDNDYTRLSLKLSKKIENIFSKIIKFFFNQISSTINE